MLRSAPLFLRRDALLIRGPSSTLWIPALRSSAKGALQRVRDTRLCLLPQRLENLQQFGVDEFIAADHVTASERVVIALDAADDTAGFAHDDLSGRHVPR